MIQLYAVPFLHHCLVFRGLAVFGVGVCGLPSGFPGIVLRRGFILVEATVRAYATVANNGWLWMTSSG